MERSRSGKKNLGLDRESMEPLSRSDPVRDSANDREGFARDSPSLHRPTPIPQNGVFRASPAQTSPTMRVIADSEDDEHEQHGEGRPQQNGHSQADYLNALQSAGMDEALLGPGRAEDHSARHSDELPAPPRHVRFGSMGSQESPSNKELRASGGNETSLASTLPMRNSLAGEMVSQSSPVRAQAEDDQAVARFLRTTQGLSYKVIGDLLGEGNPRCLSILRLFCDSFDFADLPFETAFRGFLETFRLPLESQKIYRILEEFASQYWRQCGRNSPFRSADAVMTLSYSAIILNTDLHNPNVKAKMTEQQFLDNNRGINAGQDFSPKLLRELYHNIQQSGLRIPASAELPSQKLEVEGTGKARRACCGWCC